MAMSGDTEKRGEESGESISAAEIHQYLTGVDYPADKQEIVEVAKSNSAPDNVMSFLDRLPDQTYNTPAEVEEEFGKIA